MHTIYENILFTQLQAPIVISATTEVTSINHTGYEINSHIINVGVDSALDGSNYWTFKLQESDDNSTFTDVTDLNCLSIVNNNTVQTSGSTVVIDAVAEDDVVVQFEYRGLKEYSRIVMTETGTLTTPLAVTALQERASIAPVIGRSA